MAVNNGLGRQSAIPVETPVPQQLVIRAFDMQPNGALALASDRVYATLRGERPGGPDGMKVDVEGNMYCGGSGGIWVLDPDGKHLGTIVHGDMLLRLRVRAKLREAMSVELHF